MKTLFLLLPILALLTGCYSTASYERHAAERTAKLRQIYPPGTTKAEVQAKWGDSKPDFSATRPPAGWSAYPNKYMAKAVLDRETATGKSIQSVDRYWGPDGWLSLCRCYYYYDSEDRIVDVEWEYMSD